MENVEITFRVPVADARKILEYVAELEAVREVRPRYKPPVEVDLNEIPF